MAMASVPARLGGSGEIEIALKGKQFRGRWVYSAQGGSIAFGSATVFSGTDTATAFGQTVAAPASGNGTVLASASDGSSLRCVFNYSEWTATGTGECQDNSGEIYDLQIH
jgi:hypothetical protein